jgi:Vacuolar protein sorting-associated protein 62
MTAGEQVPPALVVAMGPSRVSGVSRAGRMAASMGWPSWSRSESPVRRWTDGPRSAARRLANVVLLALLCLALSPVAEVAAQTDQEPAPAPSPEEELVARYAPVMYMKREVTACDQKGEPYRPTSVEISFDDPSVVLRQDVEGRPIVVRAPTAKDLAGKDASYYVDLPGNPRKPGCSYERKAKARMRELGLQDITYAHIAREEGRQGIAIQYWFYYYFNRFNDLHESDWEMIQVVFDADTVEEALTQEPTRVAFAQHEGGETAHWTDAKLQKEDGHPVVYSASGSHASYYGSAVWIGWGDHGSGLGCDITTGPSFRLALKPKLVPTTVTDSASEDAWLSFAGLWGKKLNWVYNGPKGPNEHRQWLTPISWMDGLRDSSLQESKANLIGVGPSTVFCKVVSGASLVFTLDNVYPKEVFGALALAAIAVLWLILLSRHILGAALRMFVAHLWSFVLIGLLLVPSSLLLQVVRDFVVDHPPFDTVVELTNRSPLVRLLIGVVIGTINQVLIVLLVVPAAIEAVGQVRAGQRPSVRRAYLTAFEKAGTMIREGLRALIPVAALAITIVGIPWAIRRAVRWGFFGQAVVLDHARPRHALERSAAVVGHHWWRAFAIATVLLFIAVVVGPLLGVVLMIVAKRSVDFVNATSSLVYAVTIPFATIGATLFYLELKERA